jgi:hypothetical protein
MVISGLDLRELLLVVTENRVRSWRRIRKSLVKNKGSEEGILEMASLFGDNQVTRKFSKKGEI